MIGITPELLRTLMLKRILILLLPMIMLQILILKRILVLLVIVIILQMLLLKNLLVLWLLIIIPRITDSEGILMMSLIIIMLQILIHIYITASNLLLCTYIIYFCSIDQSDIDSIDTGHGSSAHCSIGHS